MDRKRMTRILARADRRDVAALAAEIQKTHAPIVVKEPGKTLAMIKMREPVKESLFYIGETVVCEASVEIGGVRGMAVLMGGDPEKTLDMAIIDAAVNKGVFTGAATLLALEKGQLERIKRENAMHLKTMVNFESMDRGSDDLAADKKTRF
ncbi:MAG: phosphonate C-P lyase system protein PhnG [Gracilibacteraceae bacterium]|nr:phosphonate C-P lyase system protein PhnG [Gracilibacteraceae bacterium]